LLALGIIVFRTSSRLLFFYPARVLQKNLRVELLEKLEAVSPTRYRHHSDGQLFQVLQMDMEQLRALIGFALLQVGNIVVAMVVLVPKIIGFNENLIYALTPLVIAFIFFTIFVSYNRKYYKLVQDFQGEVQNVIIESYAGKKTIKNYHAEESFINWFKEFSKLELSYFYKAGLGIGVSLPLLPVGMGLSLIWGGHIIFQEGLGASSLILFSGFIFLFMEPIMFLSWIGVVFARSYGSWQRIKNLVKDITTSSELEEQLLENNVEIKDGEFLETHIQFWEELMTFNFPIGKWSVLFGKTGCGKSTVLTSIADILTLKKKNISYVAQDPYLYNDSIENNIFLGQEKTPERIEEAYNLLCLFGLDYLASNQEALLRMEVGEKGKRLSGGQSKRLALVRSLMAKADILVWDDPFSSVDLILEKRIIEELKAWQSLKGKTIILSSHRLTTVRASDYCLYLERERGLVESGEANSLLNPEFETYEYFKQQMV
ncbi:MAG: ABC transporter ATP-binding protein/permease, partial [Halobacteriovoraceae bacterium]|nr:ABC transporter ATP-binding protein/permease [Halobacteriovoraceae bacterium]